MSKKLISILLGFLTFGLTPLVALIVALPLFILTKVSENLNPILLIAGIFGLRDLGGFFMAQIILIGFIALLGDLATALLSWFITHSKKLARISFVSALILQILALTIALPAALKKSQQTAAAGIAQEKGYEQYGQIRNVSFELLEPYSSKETTNLHPEYGPLYAKLTILTPLTINQAGIYQLTIRYNTMAPKSVIQKFEAGEQLVKIQFLANESSGYGYYSPASAKAKAAVELSLVTYKKELLDKIKSSNNIDEKTLQQFLKDEGLETNSTVYKFVAKKEVQF